MEIDIVNDQVAFKNKESVVKALLYVKLLEKNIKLTDNELGILSLVADDQSKSDIISKALNLGYIKSSQSGENFISKMVNLGLIDKISPGKRKINEEYLPSLKSGLIGVTLKIHNLATD